MSSLPKPDGWRDRYLLMGAGVVVTCGGFAYFGYILVESAGRSHWLASTIAACGAVFFGIVSVGIFVQLTSATKLRGRYDEAGTSLDAPPTALWLLATLVALGLGIALYLRYGARVVDDLPAPTSRDSGRLIVLLVFSVGGVVVLLWKMARGAEGKPVVVLSPRGVEYRFGGAHGFAVAWDDIVDITGVPPAGRKKIPYPIVFECADGTSAVLPSANTWTPGGTGLYYLCRFYLKNPAARHELVDGAALERLAAERIPVA